jgi:hypothetical protein
MRELYDIVTKQNIPIPHKQQMKISTQLNLDYTLVGKVLNKHLFSVSSRYIHPDNKDKIFTLVEFETKQEYDCVRLQSLTYYLDIKFIKNDYKYVYELMRGRQKLASIGGRVFYLKSINKSGRYRKMKYGGGLYTEKLEQQNLRLKIANNLRNRVRSALRVFRAKKENKTLDLLGCNISFLMGYLTTKFTENMTWENYGKWHIDHKIPCASFDLTNIEEQKKCFHYTNLQPLWAVDNLRKKDKLIY